MCEFTVILSEEVIARKVIKAKVNGNSIVMADVSGNITSIEGASIVNVDTIMAELILKKD